MIEAARSSADPPPRATMMTSRTWIVEIAHAGDDFACSAISLDLRGKDEHVGAVMAALKNVQDVAQSGGLGRSDDADSLRKRGDRLLAGGIEQAFGFEFGFELLKGDLQCAGALRLKVLG